MIKKRSYCRDYVYNPREKRSSSSRWGAPSFLYLILIIVCVGFLMGYVVLQTMIATTNYEIKAAHGEISALEEDVRGLRIEIVQKTNLRNVERRAKEELGMSRPTDQAFVFLEKDIPQEESLPEVHAFGGNLASIVYELRDWMRERATVAAGALGE